MSIIKTCVNLETTRTLTIQLSEVLARWAKELERAQEIFKGHAEIY